MKAQGACPGRLTAMRVVVFVLLFLAGGAIVNVGVAWACSGWIASRCTLSASGGVGEGEVVWFVEVQRRFGGVMIERTPHLRLSRYQLWPEVLKSFPPSAYERDKLVATSISRDVPNWSVVHNLSAAGARRPMFPTEYGFGWPMLAMRCADDHMAHFIRFELSVDAEAESLIPQPDPDCVQDGIRLGSTSFGDQFRYRFLPFRPIWPGFAINTVFYAAILSLLWTTPFAIRRWRRIRGGRCGACGYPIGASPVCTECGRAVKVGGA